MIIFKLIILEPTHQLDVFVKYSIDLISKIKSSENALSR